MRSEQVRLQDRRQFLRYGAVAQRSESGGDAVDNTMLLDDFLDGAAACRHRRERTFSELGPRPMPGYRFNIAQAKGSAVNGDICRRGHRAAPRMPLHLAETRAPH